MECHLLPFLVADLELKGQKLHEMNVPAIAQIVGLPLVEIHAHPSYKFMQTHTIIEVYNHTSF